MYRWKACPQSVHACENIVSVENEWAKAGTLAHDYMAKVLLARDPSCLDAMADREMAQAVMLYYETVMTDYMCRKTNPPNGRPENFEHMWVEKKLDLSSIYPKCFGTADTILWDAVPRTLSVYDFKYGTDPVDPTQNEQELYYALGAMVTLGLPVLDLNLIIVQPRVRRRRKVSRWSTDIVRLMDFEEELKAACRATEPKDAPLVAGRHCYWCPAKPTCSAHKALANAEAAAAFSDFPTHDNDGFDDEVMGLL